MWESFECLPKLKIRLSSLETHYCSAKPFFEVMSKIPSLILLCARVYYQVINLKIMFNNAGDYETYYTVLLNKLL